MHVRTLLLRIAGSACLDGLGGPRGPRQFHQTVSQAIGASLARIPRVCVWGLCGGCGCPSSLCALFSPFPYVQCLHNIRRDRAAAILTSLHDPLHPLADCADVT